VLHDVGVGTRTVVLTTHNLDRGLNISERVAVLVGGRITYQMDKAHWDPDRLRAEYARQTTE
jgi:ABC-type multidrug transport system ATPase subunit